MASLFGFPLTINFLELLKLALPLILIVLFHPMYSGPKANFLRELQELETQRTDFQDDVAVAEKGSGKGRKPVVRRWMEDVDSFIEEDAKAFQNSWVYSVPLLCDVACWWADLVNRARELKTRRGGITAPFVGSIPLTLPFLDPRKMKIPIVGGEETLAAIRRHLEDDQVEVIGIHGMLGIGKTTYLKVIAYEQWELIEELKKNNQQRRRQLGEQSDTTNTAAGLWKAFCSKAVTFASKLSARRSINATQEADGGGRQADAAAASSSTSQSNAVDREADGGGSQPDDGQGDAVVLWTDISEAKEPNIVIDLQKSIGDQLGLSLLPAVAGSEALASVILGALKEKQFILFVDGVQRDIISRWEAVGVPKISKCKIVFAARSSEACKALADETVKVNPLTEDESWTLFLQTVGETRLTDGAMEGEARAMAARCGGLPHALTAVAEAAKSFTTLHEWRKASEWWNAPVTSRTPSGMHSLKGFLERMEAYLRRQLPEPEDRCLLYCSLFPKDQPIHEAQLIDYWIGEGFLEEWIWKDVRKEGEAVILQLRQKDIMMSSGGGGGGGDEKEIRLHDVVSRTAMWMTGGGRNGHRVYLTSAAMPRLGVDEAINHFIAWEKAERISYIGSKSDVVLPRAPVRAEMPPCSNLLTLLLGADRGGSASQQEINHSCRRRFPWDVDPQNFFPLLSKLRVLDLSGAEIINGRFPEGIDSLVELSYLNLSYTSIVELPGGLEKLQRLRQLRLRGTTSLSQMISHESISNCSLQALDLLSSGANSSRVEVSRLREFNHLSELGMSVTSGSSSTYLDNLLSSPELCASTAFLELCRVEGLTHLHLSQVFQMMENLRELSVEMTSGSTVEVIIGGGQLPNLETLSLAYVNIQLDPNPRGSSGGHLLASLRRLDIVHGRDHGDLSWVLRLSPDRVLFSSKRSDGAKEETMGPMILKKFIQTAFRSPPGVAAAVAAANGVPPPLSDNAAETTRTVQASNVGITQSSDPDSTTTSSVGVSSDDHAIAIED